MSAPEAASAGVPPDRRQPVGSPDADLLAEVEWERTAREEADAERARVFRLLSQAPALVGITRGPDHMVEFVNPPMRALLRPSREFLGMPARQAFPELKDQGFFELLDQVYTSGERFVGRAVRSRLAEWPEDRYFDFVYEPICDAGGKVEGIFMHAVDVTQQVLAERERERRERHAGLSADIGAALTESGELRSMLQRCTEAMVRRLHSAFARIWTLNEAEQVLELQASAGIYTHIDGRIAGHHRVPLGMFKIGLIAQERLPHLTNQVIGDPRVHDQEWARREGMVAFAGYPLLVEGRLVGVMAMFARQALPNDTLDALGATARMVAAGIARKRVEEERDRLLTQIRNERERLLQGFDQAPAAIAMLRGPDHVLEVTNARYRQLIAHRPIVGKPVREALPEIAG